MQKTDTEKQEVPNSKRHAADRNPGILGPRTRLLVPFPVTGKQETGPSVLNIKHKEKPGEYVMYSPGFALRRHKHDEAGDL